MKIKPGVCAPFLKGQLLRKLKHELRPDSLDDPGLYGRIPLLKLQKNDLIGIEPGMERLQPYGDPRTILGKVTNRHREPLALLISGLPDETTRLIDRAMEDVMDFLVPRRDS